MSTVYCRHARRSKENIADKEQSVWSSIQGGYNAIIAKVGLSGSKSSYGFDVSLGCTFYLVCTRAVGVRFQVSLSDFDATYSQSWSRGQLFGSRNCRLRIVIFVLALRQGRDRGPRIRRYFRKKE